MDDRIRASDADRDRVTARLREHFATGRLTSEELDERVTAALHAKTFGELRRVLADLPEPAVVSAGPPGLQQAPPLWAAHRRPRSPLLPLVLIALIAAVLLPGGGFVVFAFVKLMLLLWLVTAVAGLVLATRFRRRMRRRGRSGYSGHGHSRGYWP